MEEWNVIGFQKDCSFVGQDGERVRGLRLFLVAPADPTTGSVGQVCNIQFLSPRVAYDPAVGDKIRLYFNRYGKIQSVEVV